MRVAWMIPVLALAWQPRAEACGCFTQPNVQTPVVQAGERILFAHEGNKVVAYIQIQYQGSADHFGWLVPLPSIPTLEVGTDELFVKLGNTTQPTFTLTTNNLCRGTSSSSTSSGIGCGDNATAGFNFASVSDLGARPSDGGMNPVVVQSSVGPYDYAVLKADDQTEMSTWLNDNGYFVPDATGAAVKPYLHPGAFFLALKLRAGESTGDITPIVLRYQSDLPMIPITLTQVGAVPNMGVLVWVLGGARAIPRNYHHTVLDEVAVWMGANYQQQIIAAVKDAPGRHSFVTEYAGSPSVMSQQLYYNGRFGNLASARTISDPSNYIDYLKNNGYLFDSTLYAILQRFIPMPQRAVVAGIPVTQFYDNYDFYAEQYAPNVDAGEVPFTFDPIGITDEIEMRIVTPTKNAQALFDKNAYLTRLYTTISPADMNLDPVFSENPDLPNVPLNHTATLNVPCSNLAWLTTDQGFEVQYPNSRAPSITGLPPALRTETLREAGQPQVETDNSSTLKSQLGSVNKDTSDSSSGCDVSTRARNQMGTALLVLFAMIAIRIRRRRRA